MRKAHKTARVVTLSASDVRDIYRARELIESPVLRQLASSGQVPHEAVAAHAELIALANAEPRELVEPDMRFHRALVDAFDSERTSRSYAALASEVMLCMSHVQGASLLSNEMIIAEHGEILKHLGAGDGEAAAMVLASHLQRAAERLASLIE